MNSNFTGYKALVCIFLNGGNSASNFVVPTGTTQYNQYATSRAGLALSQPSLLSINGTAADGNTYGFHPDCPELQTIANAGNLAILQGVGTLVQPTTKAQYLAGSVSLPSQLFSHIDQQAQWMTSYAGSPSRIGWAGRAADLFLSDGMSISLAAGMSIGTQEYWTQGNLTNTYTIGTNGAADFQLKNYSSAMTTGFNAAHGLADSDSNLLIKQLRATQVSTSSKLTLLTSVLSAAGTFSTVFDTSDVLQNQLYMVARIIKAQSTSGDHRQMFFVQLGGFDTHNAELSTQITLLGQVSKAFNVFNNAMAEISQQNNVTTFTNADFSRTLSSNGDGSDHAWASTHIIMGGAVKGYGSANPTGAYYGIPPSVVLGSSDDVDGSGRLIPTTSTDQYAATLLNWFGIQTGDIAGLFPNISNFTTRNLGFI